MARSLSDTDENPGANRGRMARATSEPLDGHVTTRQARPEHTPAALPCPREPL